MQTLSIYKKIIRSSMCFFTLHFLDPKDINQGPKRKELILNTILIGLIIITALLDCELINSKMKLGNDYSGLPIQYFLGVCVFFIILLICSRLGLKKFASHLLIYFCLAITLYCQYIWGTSLPSALLGDALIITISSVLIGRRYSVIISIIIGIKLMILAHIESKHHVIAVWKTIPITVNTGIQLALMLLIITIISWIYSREIENSLTHALQSEKALKDKNDSLEVIVEQRTRELKLAEFEKYVQLYKFVEFGKLSAGVFHDILNPLSIISLNIELLQSSSYHNIPEIKENISNAVKASKRMTSFIESMKKQIQDREFKILFSVNNEIKDVLLLFNYKATKNNVRIFLNFKTEINFYGNPLKFHQVIANLISNAIDSFQGHNTNENNRAIYISIKKKQELLIINIKDRGIGISQEVLKHIFDPFFTTKQEQGIGIGLSTTKYIIERNFSGSIQVRSTPGVGTNFTITLPLLSNTQN